MHDTFVSESDSRLRDIKYLTKTLKSNAASPEESPAMAMALISLCEQERLYEALGDSYMLAARAYHTIGDRWSASKYARLAIEFDLLLDQVQNPDILSMLASQVPVDYEY